MTRRVRVGLRIAWGAFNRFQDHAGPDRAAAVSYYTLLSLLPLLIFLISIGVRFLGSFEAAYQGTLFLIRGVVVPLDPNSLQTLREFVESASRFQWPGLVLLAWTSRRIFAALLSALERVFGVPGRSFAKHNLLAMGLVFVMGGALLMTMAVTMAVATSQGLLERVGAPAFLTSWGARLLLETLPILITFSFFFLLYRLVPQRAVGTAQAAAGAALATALWEMAKGAFAYYVRNLARYASVYGTLEGVIVLAIWLEISASIILYCGEVVAIAIAPERKQRRIAFTPDPSLAPSTAETP